MCGILAILLQHTETSLTDIVAGYEMLTNRGPDDQCLIITKQAILGFRRLAIMDTTEKGMQPFIQGEISLLCNGEIYNHAELKSKYNLECTSGSDCECILHLYRKLGFEQTVRLLSGDFAIVIIHGPNIHIARDRVGVRPLFYGITDSGNFSVASYARALMGYCSDVKQLAPSMVTYYGKTGLTVTSAYRLAVHESITDASLAAQEIRVTLEEAVRARLMSDRPIGCLLSGGLDSSLITSLLCSSLGNQNVRTYSVGMEGSSDLAHARTVASALGTQHQEVVFTPAEGFAAIPDVIRDLESYDITTVRASVGMWLLSKWISQNTKDVVIYSGEGSDELFCGYLYFHYAPSSEELGLESERLIRDLYKYDVLRADRCVSSHGLELRVPFLDRNMIDLCRNISPELRSPIDGVEKYLLRKAFSEGSDLPAQVLWRQKDGMSDGISGSIIKWYKQIQEFVDPLVSDEELKSSGFQNKEGLYYKRVYDTIFANYQASSEYWLPKWVDHGGDPSGRILPVSKH